MDPINIIVGLNIIAVFGANISGAKRGVRAAITTYKEKPQTWLQDLPVWISVITLFAMILGVFQVGTLTYKSELFSIRITGLLIYLIFSWFQVWAFKSLGENYSQQILIYKNHTLVTKGPYKYIRHPQYISQFVVDVCAGLALLSWVLLPLALIELPFFIMRAAYEDMLLQRHFKESFTEYKKRSGFIIPFIG